MGLLPIGGIMINDATVKLASSKKIAKTLFSNPEMIDTLKNYTNGNDAKQALDQFGKFAKGLSLDPKHAYKYCNAHGSAQLFDVTTNKSVIEAVEKLKRPFITLFKKNIFKKIFK